jgi:hypothetical protein
LKNHRWRESELRTYRFTSKKVTPGLHFSSFLVPFRTSDDFLDSTMDYTKHSTCHQSSEVPFTTAALETPVTATVNIIMSLETLPDVSIQQILYFLSDPKDFRSFELTCWKMERIIRCDEQWKHCKGLWRSGMIKTNRHRACIDENLIKIREIQGKADGPISEPLGHIRQTQESFSRKVIMDDLGVNGWKKLVNDTLQYFRPENGLNGPHSFFLRGDTLAVLAESLQFYMTEQFKRANLICDYRMERHRLTQYPDMSDDDYELAEQLLLGVHGQSLNLTFGHVLNLVERDNLGISDFDVLPFLGRTMRDKIVRKLAFNAGVVQMRSSVYDLAWQSLIQLIVVLVTPACIELVEMSTLESGRKRSLDTTDMRMVPPPALRQIIGISLHTLVPRQIEDAASCLGIGRVCGDSWLVCEGSTEEEEVAAAKAQYVVVKNEDGSAKERSGSEEDDASHFEDSAGMR